MGRYLSSKKLANLQTSKHTVKGLKIAQGSGLFDGGEVDLLAVAGTNGRF